MESVVSPLATKTKASRGWGTHAAGERGSVAGGLFGEVSGRERVFAGGEGEERGVELYESCVDGGVLLVACVAGACGGKEAAVVSVVEAEEGPSSRELPGGEALRVFDVHFKAHAFSGLIVAGMIDGALAAGTADLEDEDGPVGPCAGGEEAAVGFGVDEDVVEHGVAGSLIGAGTVVHVDACGKVDPLAVVGGKLKLALGVVDRLVVLSGLDLERSGGRDPDEGEGRQSKSGEKEGKLSFRQGDLWAGVRRRGGESSLHES